MSQNWTWSAEHGDYFLVSYDATGKVVYSWARQQVNQQDTAPQARSTRRVDSAAYDVSPSYIQDQTIGAAIEQPVVLPALQAQPSEPVPYDVRQQQPNFIAGTPRQGWYDPLDSSYRMRTGHEARDFFRVGRVFSMLYTENAGETAKIAPDDDAFTVVRHGGTAYTQIRRFVVVSVRKGFVHACAISTYRGQGTFKKGCDPTEHALIYNSGKNPEACYFAGEKEKGLKQPIEVVAADASSLLTKESRIRFGKIYSIEWNVKVKDIGMVVDDFVGILREHHHGEVYKMDT